MPARTLLAAVAIVATLVAAHADVARPQTTAPDQPTSRLRALFDEYWQWQLREYPEWATGIGDHR